MSVAPPVRLFIYVQHLLGIGHVRRAALLVKACLAKGFEVTVASGGNPVPGFGFDAAKLVQLPPVRSADSGFTALVQQNGMPLSDTFKHQRRQQLLEAYDKSQANVLLIENYPFGRRQLRWELKPLLKFALKRVPGPLVVSSIRDILQKRKLQREIETVDLIKRYFDAVLVHGNADFLPLGKSFTLAEEIQEKIHYTGYVVKAVQRMYSDSSAGHHEVIVSAGGGAAGYRLMQVALNARRNGYLSDRVWRFLLGPNMPAVQQQDLRDLAPAGCMFEFIRTDFAELLERCHLSISQAGYNTVADILQAGCPALLLPFESGGETEQRLRADKLSEVGRCSQMSDQCMETDKFIQCSEQARKMNLEVPSGISLLGAEATADLLSFLLQRKIQEKA